MVCEEPEIVTAWRYGKVVLILVIMEYGLRAGKQIGELVNAM